MSLTSRLVLLVLLALAGLGAATTALVRAREETDAAREATAFAQGDSVTRELLERRAALTEDVVAALVAGAPPPPGLARSVALLIAPLVDASAGYCTPDGALLVHETVAPFAFTPPVGMTPTDRPPGAFGAAGAPQLLPLDRDVVVAACRGREGGPPTHIRFAAPNDLLFVTIAGAHAPFAPWALVRMPNRARSPGQQARLPLLVVIAITMLALVVLCVDTVLQLRRESGQIAKALVAAQADLRAPIPHPRARELARIADGLRAMTEHLAEAREREVDLQRRLGHEQRLAALGRVAAGVAHEIRNPLAGMKLRLDAMARRKLDERSANDVVRSLAEVARLDGVVGSLLLVARKEPAVLEDVDLSALTDERLLGFEPLAAKRRVRLVREGEARGRADPKGLTRVVDNLVRNAIEASPEDAEVVATLRVEGRDVVLRVSDRGAGVPVEREPELFEPFFTSKPDGTGLGLSLSRAAVEGHGGTLTYARESGTTTFTVRLPDKAIP